MNTRHISLLNGAIFNIALIGRTRSLTDRHRIMVTATEQAKALIKQSPPLLQEQFSNQLANLQDWELAQTLSVLQRVALMMDARQVDASPLLATGSVTAEPEMVEIVTRPGDTQPTDSKDDDMGTAGLVQGDSDTPSAA